jgi:hypothetical protein
MKNNTNRMTTDELIKLTVKRLQEGKINNVFLILDGEQGQTTTDIILMDGFPIELQAFLAGIHAQTKYKIGSLRSISQISAADFKLTELAQFAVAKHRDLNQEQNIEILLIHLHRIQEQKHEFLAFEVKHLQKQIQLIPVELDDEASNDDPVIEFFTNGYELTEGNPDAETLNLAAETYLKYTRGDTKDFHKAIPILEKFLKDKKRRH